MQTLARSHNPYPDRKIQDAFNTKNYEIIKSPYRIKKLEYKLEDLIAKRRKERKIAISSN